MPSKKERLEIVKKDMKSLYLNLVELKSQIEKSTQKLDEILNRIIKIRSQLRDLV